MIHCLVPLHAHCNPIRMNTASKKFESFISSQWCLQPANSKIYWEIYPPAQTGGRLDRCLWIPEPNICTFKDKTDLSPEGSVDPCLAKIPIDPHLGTRQTSYLRCLPTPIWGKGRPLIWEVCQPPCRDITDLSSERSADPNLGTRNKVVVNSLVVNYVYLWYYNIV